MSTKIERLSELIWNIVGALSAILLLLYISTSFFGVRVDKFIPVSGGLLPALDRGSVPTAIVATAQATPTVTSLAVPPSATASEVPSLTMESITATATATVTASVTPTPDPFPSIIAGYGPEQQYTLHKLQPGESYAYLADLYDTPVAVLETLNFNKEGKRLWEGQYIVILPGQQQLDSSISQFTVLILLENTRLQDVAVKFGVSVDELRYYNLLDSEIVEVIMRVLLIPIVG